jgi:hypothetical protein
MYMDFATGKDLSDSSALDYRDCLVETGKTIWLTRPRLFGPRLARLFSRVSRVVWGEFVAIWLPLESGCEQARTSGGQGYPLLRLHAD